jgi:hypothetical protein
MNPRNILLGLGAAALVGKYVYDSFSEKDNITFNVIIF